MMGSPRDESIFDWEEVFGQSEDAEIEAETSLSKQTEIPPTSLFNEEENSPLFRDYFLPSFPDEIDDNQAPVSEKDASENESVKDSPIINADEINVLQEKNAALNQELIKFQQELAEKNKQIEQLKIEKESFKQQNKHLKNSISKIETDSEKQKFKDEEKIAGLKKKKKLIQKLYDAKVEKQTEKKANMAEKNKKINQIRSELNNEKIKNNKLNDQLEKCTDEIQLLKEKVEAQEEELQKLKRKNTRDVKEPEAKKSKTNPFQLFSGANEKGKKVTTPTKEIHQSRMVLREKKQIKYPR